MNYRRNLIRLVTFLGGLYFFAEFILPETVLVQIGIKQNHEHITNGFILVGVMAIGLGLINLVRVHGNRILFVRKGWRNSIALLVGLSVMFVITGLSWLQGVDQARRMAELSSLGNFALRIEADAASGITTVKPARERLTLLTASLTEQLARIESDIALDGEPVTEPARLARKELIDSVAAVRSSDPGDPKTFDGAVKVAAGNLGKVLRLRAEVGWTQIGYIFLYEGIFISLGAAMFSLLGVYIAAAAYRSFRVRSVESSLMMVAAILVMLGQIPFGQYLSEDMPAVRQWLLEVPNSAAFRAIRIGAAIAGLIMAIRMWLSIESETFSSKESNDA